MKDKFKDIKVGDIVIVPVEVPYGYTAGRTFYCKKLVERLTKTQFVVEGKHYRKSDGCMIGNTWKRAIYEGDENIYGEIVKDETKDMLEFEGLVKDVAKLENIIHQVSEMRNNIRIHNVAVREATRCFGLLSESLKILKKMVGEK